MFLRGSVIAFRQHPTSNWFAATQGVCDVSCRRDSSHGLPPVFEAWAIQILLTVEPIWFQETKCPHFANKQTLWDDGWMLWNPAWQSLDSLTDDIGFSQQQSQFLQDLYNLAVKKPSHVATITSFPHVCNTLTECTKYCTKHYNPGSSRLALHCHWTDSSLIAFNISLLSNGFLFFPWAIAGQKQWFSCHYWATALVFYKSDEASSTFHISRHYFCQETAFRNDEPMVALLRVCSECENLWCELQYQAPSGPLRRSTSSQQCLPSWPPAHPLALKMKSSFVRNDVTVSQGL